MLIKLWKKLKSLIRSVSFWAVVAIIKFYQLVIAPLFKVSACKFYPSCSVYTMESVKELGVVKGLYRGFLRFLKCR